MGIKKDKRYQVMRHDGTGKAVSVSGFRTAQAAETIRQGKRREVPKGSSDWFTVEATRRKGRR